MIWHALNVLTFLGVCVLVNEVNKVWKSLQDFVTAMREVADMRDGDDE